MKTEDFLCCLISLIQKIFTELFVLSLEARSDLRFPRNPIMRFPKFTVDSVSHLFIPSSPSLVCVKIADAFRQALVQSSEPWFPNLSKLVAKQSWRRLAHHGFNPSNYGTHRWLEKDSTAERLVIATLNLDHSHQCRFEVLPAPTRARYEQLGLVFPAYSSKTKFVEVFHDALSVIASIPSLHTIVAEYLRTLHILQTPRANFDVSYSDPVVPFSIFVSVPISKSDRTLRLVESIIHECMHLQLTLINIAVPLVGDRNACAFSPWQRTMRPIDGVLHGLYVFSVIYACFNALEHKHSLTLYERAHIEKRQVEITQEVMQVSQLSSAGGLTDIGRSLAGYVLRSFNT